MQAETAVEPMSPTRRSMVLAAERLVAKYGVDGVTIRMVNAEAGMKNMSAIYYHFKSRDGLIRAVWEYRMATINPQRQQMLAAVAPTDMEGIAWALIRPLADQLEPRPEGNHYIRFQERVEREADYDAYGPRREWAEGWIRADAMLRQALRGHSPEIIDVKLRFVRTLISSGLAGMEADLERGDITREALPAMISALKDGVMALLLMRSGGAISPPQA